jgi:hypothetical protein
MKRTSHTLLFKLITCIINDLYSMIKRINFQEKQIVHQLKLFQKNIHNYNNSKDLMNI